MFPPEGLCGAEPEGGPISLCIISVRKHIWHFQNPHIPSAFLKSRKCFIPRRDSAEQSPKGSNCFYLGFIGVGRGTGGFNFRGGNPPFWKLENVLSPGGMVRKHLPRGPYVSPSEGCLGFQKHHFTSAFLKTWKCFIPRRESALQTPKGSNCF